MAAADLMAAGAARCVEARDALAATLLTWLTDDALRNQAAERAFGYIQDHLGAASRTAAVLSELLRSTSA